MRFLLFLSSFCFVSFCWGSDVAPDHQGEDASAYFSSLNTVILHAEDFSELNGFSIDRIGLYRFSNAELEPLPFQIDEMATTGLVWFPDGKLELNGQPGIFDNRDELLFQQKDMGARLPDDYHQQSAESALVEIRVGDQYVYVREQGEPEYASEAYISHNLESGRSSTSSYRLDVDPDNELNWLFLGYQDYQEGQTSIIDTLRMRMQGSVLVPFPRVTLDNNNLRPEITGFHLGPIRSIVHMETKVVIGGIPVMKMYLQAHRYPHHYEAHTYAHIPLLYKSALRDPMVSVSIDGNHQQDAVIWTAKGGNLSGVVDGHMSGDEKKLVQKGLSTDENWILFNSNRKFILLTEMMMPKNLHGYPVELVYQDDRNLHIEPERYTGQWPNLGYAFRGMPPERDLTFSVRLLFDQGLHGLKPGEYARMRSRIPQASVRTIDKSVLSQSDSASF